MWLVDISVYMGGLCSYMYVYACMCVYVLVELKVGWYNYAWYMSTTLESPYKINVFIEAV